MKHTVGAYYGCVVCGGGTRCLVGLVRLLTTFYIPLTAPHSLQHVLQQTLLAVQSSERYAALEVEAVGVGASGASEMVLAAGARHQHQSQAELIVNELATGRD